MGVARRRKITDSIKSVRIGPYTVEVREGGLAEKSRGEADLRNMVICIDTSVGFQLQRNSLMHEAVHFIVTFMLDGIKERGCEAETVALANGFEALLLDNPKLSSLYRGKP